MCDAGVPSPVSSEPGAPSPKPGAGLAPLNQRPLGTPWSDEREALLKCMFAAGESFKAMADALGDISRNAVITKADRLGLKRGKPAVPGGKAPSVRASLRSCQMNLMAIIPRTPVKADQRPGPISMCDPVLNRGMRRAFGASRVGLEDHFPVPYMPKLPAKMLDNVFYLYPDAASAESGADFGGTGFVVAMPASVPSRSYLYAVTNWHVAVRAGASVIRINRKDGTPEIIEYGPEDWQFDPRYDIAVVPIGLDSQIHKFTAVGCPEGLVKQEDIEREGLGPGEDVFMIGRFIDHDGGAVNQPAVRFGNISVMPTLIEQPNGAMVETYCIDMHSRSGYSGSPVYAYRTPGYNLEDKLTEGSLLMAGVNYIALLGIHCSQFPEQWEITTGAVKKADASAAPLVTDGAYVKGLSGMTCVLPAWLIGEVLNTPKLVEIRRLGDEKLKTMHFITPAAE